MKIYNFYKFGDGNIVRVNFTSTGIFTFKVSKFHDEFFSVFVICFWAWRELESFNEINLGHQAFEQDFHLANQIRLSRFGAVWSTRKIYDQLFQYVTNNLNDRSIQRWYDMHLKCPKKSIEFCMIKWIRLS